MHLAKFQIADSNRQLIPLGGWIGRQILYICIADSHANPAKIGLWVLRPYYNQISHYLLSTCRNIQPVCKSYSESQNLNVYNDPHTCFLECIPFHIKEPYFANPARLKCPYKNNFDKRNLERYQKQHP